MSTELPAGFQLDDLPTGFTADAINPPMPPNMGPKAPAPGMMSQIANKHPLVGAGETALAIGSGTAGSALGGLAGMAGAALPGPQGQGANWAQAIQGAMAYQPRTTAGQQMTQTAGVPFEALARAGDWAGSKTAEASGSPALGAAANTALQAAPMMIPFGVKRAGRAIEESRAGRAADAIFDETQPAPVMEGGGPGWLESKARGLMQSAIKPGAADRRTGKADRAVETMLEKGINPTRGGMEKLDTAINKADDALSRIIEDSNASVDVHTVAGYALDQLRKAKNQVNPNADVVAVLSSIDEFLNNPAVKSRYPSHLLPVQEAQAMKRGTYESLGDKAYGELKSASVESQKALARGLKEQIAKAEPSVGPVNRELGDLVNAREVVTPRVLLEMNKNPAGLAWLAHAPMQALGFLLARDPLSKALLARGLYQSRNAPAGAINAAQYGTLPGVAQESAEEAAKK